MSVKIQAVARKPRRWESETRCLNARHKGLRTLERRVRAEARQEIADQLAQVEPSKADLECELEATRQEALDVLVAINEEYEAAIAAARRQQREAIERLPERLRAVIDYDCYESWTHHYYVTWGGH